MTFSLVSCLQSPVRTGHEQSSTHQAVAPRTPTHEQPDTNTPAERHARATIARLDRARTLSRIRTIPHYLHLCGGNSLQEKEPLLLREGMQGFIENYKNAKSDDKRVFVGKNMLRRLKSELKPVERNLDRLEPAVKGRMLTQLSMTKAEVEALAEMYQSPAADALVKQGAAGEKDVLKPVLDKLEHVYTKLEQSSDFSLRLQSFKDVAEEYLAPVKWQDGTRRERTEKLNMLKSRLVEIDQKYLENHSEEEMRALSGLVEQIGSVAIQLGKNLRSPSPGEYGKGGNSEAEALNGVWQESERIVTTIAILCPGIAPDGTNAPPSSPVSQDHAVSGGDERFDFRGEAGAVSARSDITEGSLFDIRLSSVSQRHAVSGSDKPFEFRHEPGAVSGRSDITESGLFEIRL